MSMEKPRAKTYQKSVWLTEQGRDAIQQWADEHSVSFSSAIEALALDGLAQPSHLVLAPVISALVHDAVKQQYDRIARLIAFSCYESGTAARLAGTLVRLELLQQAENFNLVDSKAEKNIYGLLEKKVFGREPTKQSKMVQSIYEKLKTWARKDTVSRMRTPLDELKTILFEQEDQDGNSQTEIHQERR